MAHPLGIHFGSSTISSAIQIPVTGFELVTIPETQPAFITYQETGCLVGSEAQKLRYSGLSISGLADTVGKKPSELGYYYSNCVPPIITLSSGEIQLNGSSYSVGNMVRDILTFHKNIITEKLKSVVRSPSVVFAVPMGFSSEQETLFKQITESVGFRIQKVVPDAICVALAYGMQKAQFSGQKILVFDCGGTSTTVSVLRLNGTSSPDILSFKRTQPKDHCGGDDVDNIIFNTVAQRYQSKSGASIADQDKWKAYEKIVNAKELFSQNQNEVQIRVRFGLKKVDETFTLGDFNSMCADPITRAVEVTKTVLQQCNLQASEIQHVLLAGGSSNLPLLRTKLSVQFPGRVRYIDECQHASLYGATEYSRELLHVLSPVNLTVKNMDGKKYVPMAASTQTFKAAPPPAIMPTIIRSPEPFYYLFIADQSGSMHSKCSDILRFFNQILSDMQNAHRSTNIKIHLGFISFEDSLHTIVSIAPVEAISQVNSFSALGYTALYDGLGYGIDAMKQYLSSHNAGSRPRVRISFWSDGGENASRQYTLSSARNLLQWAYGEGWDVIYYGTGSSAQSNSRSLGFRNFSYFPDTVEAWRAQLGSEIKVIGTYIRAI